MRTIKVAPALVIALSLLLAGCAPSTPAPEDAADDAAPVVSNEPAEEDASEERPAIIEPDEGLMATMTSVPFDNAQVESLSIFGVFDRAACVEVGERDGVTWWVVAAEGDRGSTRGAWLTDSLEIAGVEPEDRGTWIEVDSRWSEVDWDLEWLVRAESALEVARAALANA